MNELLADIKTKLQSGDYKNEEHIRLSLVARLLQQLGWNIWNPKEVHTEFVVVPNEDKTRVDVALFLRPFAPVVFIEIKCVGQIQGRLTDIERQLRDYNRNNTAMFTIITDGREWRFYYSQTGGEFSRKCFETFDFIEDTLEDITDALENFLRRSEIENENAKRKAENYLQLNQRQRMAEDCLPEARRKTNELPYPTLPQALIQLVSDRGFTLTHDEAVTFIAEASQRPINITQTPTVVLPVNALVRQSNFGAPHVRNLNPDNPGTLAHTKIIEGTFDGKSVANWRDLIDCAIRTVVKKGIAFQVVKGISRVTEVNPNDESFHQIPNTNYWLQGMDANNSWRESLTLAKKANLGISVRFQWRDKNGAAHPGEEGLLHWPNR